MYFKNPKQHSGFTLIELLVSIGIIALLTSFIVVGVSETRAKSRDAQRVADIKQLEIALEQYYSNNQEYPDSDALNTLATDGYVEEIATDPKTGADYDYNSDNENYTLEATSDDESLTCGVSSPQTDEADVPDECPFGSTGG